MDNLPCPFCGSTDLVTGSWCVDDDEAHELVNPGDLGEVPSIECNRCLGSAPAENWNRRPDPWRYPPDMPEPDQKILFTYMHPEVGESQAITAVYSNVDDWHPLVRWMPVPEFEPRSITEQKGTIADEKQVD
jgi:hypothetical protein